MSHWVSESNPRNSMTHSRMDTGFKKSIFLEHCIFGGNSYQFSHHRNRWSTKSGWFILTGFWNAGKPGGTVIGFLSVPVGADFLSFYLDDIDYCAAQYTFRGVAMLFDITHLSME